MKETDLATKVVRYFGDYEVYNEQSIFGNRCDIVVKKGPLIIAVECKLQFTTTLIYQALRHFHYSNYAYVAVPKLETNSNARMAGRKICEKLGVGIIEVPEHSPVTCRLQAAYRRNIAKPALDEKQKLAIPGAQSNNMSEFKVSIRIIETMLIKNGGKMLIDEIFKESYHWGSCQSARQCFLGYINRGILPQFERDDKVIRIKVNE